MIVFEMFWKFCHVSYTPQEKHVGRCCNCVKKISRVGVSCCSGQIKEITDVINMKSTSILLTKTPNTTARKSQI
jgi:hypothetical protein